MILAAGWSMVSEEIQVFLIVMAVVVPVAIARLVHICRRSPTVVPVSKDTVWESHPPRWSIASAFFLLLAATFWWHWGSAFLAVCCACVGLVFIVATVHSAWRHRPQWTITGMLLLTVIVAVGCTLACCLGWVVVYALIELLWLALLWPSLAAPFVWWMTPSTARRSEANHDETSK